MMTSNWGTVSVGQTWVVTNTGAHIDENAVHHPIPLDMRLLEVQITLVPY
jgi:hypothetical protein